MNFLSDTFYHVYNRGNNKQLIFLESDNYIYFLRKMKTELSDWADILAYCLMPNHYHILLYTRPDLNEEQSKILIRKIGTLQSSYTQGFNKRYNKTGSLFQQKVKCKPANVNKGQALTCFHYIHQNPLKAGLVKSMEEWEYSSYREYLCDEKTGLLQKKTSYDLLGISPNKEDFIRESLGVIVFDEGY